MKTGTGQRDVFARIAAERHAFRQKVLVQPRPPKLARRFLPTAKSDPAAAFGPLHKTTTAEELRRELERLRRSTAKFMANLAPAPEPTRLALPLTDFDWRVQTPEDLADPARPFRGDGPWKRLKVPHYGEPLGRAATFYRTAFLVTREMIDKGALFIHFNGVDYKAHVFINGAYLGSHEGFFAPFEFDSTPVARLGDNALLVRVENDAICMGNASWGEDGDKYEGDKIYAATGVGYDEPEVGWHHCPPGMGIYQDVLVEARAPIHVHDLFVRPLAEPGRAEAWIEVYSCLLERQEVAVELSVFGQNFRKAVFRNRRHELPAPIGPTVNYLRFPIEIPNPRIWDLDAPWLYQLQVKVLDVAGRTLDAAARQFGLRTFRIDEEHEPKGRFYLNGRQIRLRGANTMGHMQQCVFKKNWDQLRDDILLAKLCNMNYFRLTQRPVQPEIYQFCDRLGFLTQTDLPLFGVLRRNQFSEAARQAGETERLVRAHPCNIMVSYINEPFPIDEKSGQRQLTRPELESFFEAASHAVRLANPDRVIKPVDGDYDPPAVGLPDNHCYCGWYNGHGVDIGMLHKGCWQPIKPGWLYGCGEFGTEGLDPVGVMRRHYPKHWLPQRPEEERDWTPDRITAAQTGRFHFLWFDTQHSLSDWAAASHEHQAWVTRLMAEAFRRDSRMVSCAIHLFIDAFPSGWMKAIMDVERRPKPAYFAYRNALTPLMACLRTDRSRFFSGEEMLLEAWVCNDQADAPRGLRLHYQVESGGKVIFAQQSRAAVPVCGSAFQGFLRLRAPQVEQRCAITLRLGLLDAKGKVLHDSAVRLDVFPRPAPSAARSARVVGSRSGKAAQLARECGLQARFSGSFEPGEVILIDDFARYQRERREITRAVEQGALAVFLELPAGKHQIAGGSVEIEPCGMGARHFVSRATGHPLVGDFLPNDFKFWYDSRKGYATPFLHTTFSAPGWAAILASGNGGWSGGWRPALAAAEKRLGKGRLRICQVSLAGRLSGNPVAMIFARRLLEASAK